MSHESKTTPPTDAARELAREHRGILKLGISVEDFADILQPIIDAAAAEGRRKGLEECAALDLLEALNAAVKAMNDARYKLVGEVGVCPWLETPIRGACAAITKARALIDNKGAEG